ncbi:MAG: DMT family transporter [Planctomycetes bacterium]|nr:DMT family transporter [Planctomycetota bacterium]
MKPKTVSLIQLNLAVLMWGLTAMFSKGIRWPTTAIVGGRSLAAVGALVALVMVAKGALRLRRRADYGVMLVLGVLMGAHWLTYFQALKIAPAAVAILSLHTYPVLTALVEPFVFRERLRVFDLFLAAGVFGGVVIMTPELSLSNEVTLGILLGVASGVFFMLRNLITRTYVKPYSSSTLMLWQVLVIGALLLPMLIPGVQEAVADGLHLPATFAGTVDYSPRTLGLTVLLGVVFTAVPQVLHTASFRHLSGKTVGILATLLPFYGGFWDYVFNNEVPSGRTVIGGLIILACVLTETMRSINRA